MARWHGTTTQRGYGRHHQNLREARLAVYRPGDICADGGEPLTFWPLTVARKHLDLPHDHVNGGYKPGLACRKHNRGEGASRAGGRSWVKDGKPGDVYCTMCGKPYSRAPRNCEICGAHYHPNHGGQRSCSRACGVIIARRNRMAKGWLPPSQRPRTPPKPRPPGPVASGQRAPKGGWPASPIETYTCRYCGKLAVRRASRPPGRGLREVCDARICQLARLRANNLVARYGLAREEANAQVAELVASAMGRRRPSTRGK